MLINGEQLAEEAIFPGGEVHIRLPDFTKNTPMFTIKVTITDSSKLMQVLLVKEALDTYFPNAEKHLEMLYLPYARQDRRCREGEAFSLKVFVDLINTLKFDTIRLADVHSYVALDAFKSKVQHVTVKDIFFKISREFNTSNMLVVSPDKGAVSRSTDVADLLFVDLFIATKTRLGNKVVYQDFTKGEALRIQNRNLLIVDDICDGGATFIALAEKLRKGNPRSISLYVTHGIFSKGIAPLLDAGITKIYTTNSITKLKPIDGVLEIWDI